MLESVGIAKEKGAKIISIVNVMTSSLVRLSSISIGLNCGPEIGVAATKSFTSECSSSIQDRRRTMRRMRGIRLQ